MFPLRSYPGTYYVPGTPCYVCQQGPFGNVCTLCRRAMFAPHLFNFFRFLRHGGGLRRHHHRGRRGRRPRRVGDELAGDQDEIGDEFDGSNEYEYWDPQMVPAHATQPPVELITGAKGGKGRLLFPVEKDIGAEMDDELVQGMDPAAAQPGTVLVQNPTATASGLVTLPDGSVVPQAYAAQLPPPTDEQLMQQAVASGNVRPRLYQNRYGVLSGLFAGLLDGFGQPAPPPWAQLPQPVAVRKNDIFKIQSLKGGFPIGMYNPLCPVGHATGYVVLEDGGAPGGLNIPFLSSGSLTMYYAFHKMTPFGQALNEPFTPGIFLIPASVTYRVPLAVEYISAADNSVMMLDDRGRKFPVAYLDFLNSSQTDYQQAKELVVMQYPWAASQLSATTLDYTPSEHNPKPSATAMAGLPSGIQRQPPLLTMQRPLPAPAPESELEPEPAPEQQPVFYPPVPSPAYSAPAPVFSGPPQPAFSTPQFGAPQQPYQPGLPAFSTPQPTLGPVFQ